MFCIFLELMFFTLKKNWEKCFLFHVKSPFRSQDILKFAFVPLPSRKPPSFCNFSDVIACFTIYGKEGFLEYLKNNNNYLLETWTDFRLWLQKYFEVFCTCQRLGTSSR